MELQKRPWLKKVDFFRAVQDQLEGLYDRANLAEEAKIPILRLDIEQVSIDLLCAQSSIFPASIEQLKEEHYHDYDETSWYAIAGYLEVDRIINLINNSKIDPTLFLQLVRFIRIWTSQRAIVGNAWGFPGNYAWMILATWACLNWKKKQVSLFALIKHFFEALAVYDWSLPLAITAAGKAYKLREKQDRLPIMTSIKPSFNAFCKLIRI